METLALPLSDSERNHWAKTLDEADAGNTPIPVPTALQCCRLEHARDVQRRLLTRMLMRVRGGTLGVKIGGTSQASLEALGLEAPWTGPLLTARCHPSGTSLPRRQLNVCLVQTAIAVRLSHDLSVTAVPNRAALLAAIDAVCPAIELADTRFNDWLACRGSAIVADLGFAGHWVQGSVQRLDPGFNFRTQTVRVVGDGRPVAEGESGDVLGDPLRALALAARDRQAEGLPLRRGEWVSLGSCTSPVPWSGGGRLQADFGALGRVVVELVA